MPGNIREEEFKTLTEDSIDSFVEMTMAEKFEMLAGLTNKLYEQEEALRHSHDSMMRLSKGLAEIRREMKETEQWVQERRGDIHKLKAYV